MGIRILRLFGMIVLVDCLGRMEKHAWGLDAPVRVFLSV